MLSSHGVRACVAAAAAVARRGMVPEVPTARVAIQAAELSSAARELPPSQIVGTAVYGRVRGRSIRIHFRTDPSLVYTCVRPFLANCG